MAAVLSISKLKPGPATELRQQVAELLTRVTALEDRVAYLEACVETAGLEV